MFFFLLFFTRLKVPLFALTLFIWFSNKCKFKSCVRFLCYFLALKLLSWPFCWNGFCWDDGNVVHVFLLPWQNWTFFGYIFSSNAAFTPDTVCTSRASSFNVQTRFEAQFGNKALRVSLAAVQFERLCVFCVAIRLWVRDIFSDSISGLKINPLWPLNAKVFVLNCHQSSEPTGAARLPETVSASVGAGGMHPGQVTPLWSEELSCNHKGWAHFDGCRRAELTTLGDGGCLLQGLLWAAGSPKSHYGMGRQPAQASWSLWYFSYFHVVKKDPLLWFSPLKSW